jgi:hypothetical protein
LTGHVPFLVNAECRQQMPAHVASCMVPNFGAGRLSCIAKCRRSSPNAGTGRLAVASRFARCLVDGPVLGFGTCVRTDVNRHMFVSAVPGALAQVRSDSLCPIADDGSTLIAWCGPRKEDGSVKGTL